MDDGVHRRAGEPQADRQGSCRGVAHRELRHAGAEVMVQKPDWREMSGIDDPYVRKLARLAFLAPDIQQAIMDGRQPAGLTLQALRESDIPSSWDAQRRALGFSQPLAAACSTA